MNNQRRTQLREVLSVLSSELLIIERVCDKEQDCVDNYPENLQTTDRYEHMEAAVDNLNDAMEKIEEAKEHIQSAIMR